MKAIPKLLPLLLLLVVGPTAAVAQEPQPTVNEIFEKGETLDFDLAWLKMSGGTARMTIAPQNGGFRMTSIAKSSSFFSRIFKVRDEIETRVSGEFSTVHYVKDLNERGKLKHEETVVDEEKKTATRRRNGELLQNMVVPLPIFDPLSLIYHIRTLDLTPGRVHKFNVIADGKVYLLETTVAARETITTPAGTFAAVRVLPKMLGGGVFRDEDSRLTIWYTDDARHVPLRIQSEVKVGRITASLRAVRAGVESAEPLATPTPAR